MASGPPAGPDEDELTMWSHSLTRKALDYHSGVVVGFVFFCCFSFVLFFLSAGSGLHEHNGPAILPSATPSSGDTFRGLALV